MTQQADWREEYRIGVELIDKAHKRLFSVVRRILLLMDEEKDTEWTCIEGIKYFKSYTIEHFQEEEAYMRSIDYPDYAAHKQIHDNMRDQVIPALEQELEQSNYSKESVEHFLKTCTDWLANHIMVMDKAIAKRMAGR